MDRGHHDALAFAQPTFTELPVLPLAFAATRAVAAHFHTFTSWCAALHLVYLAAMIAAPVPAVRECLFPMVHFNAWAVLVGSHVLLYFRPRALSELRIRGLDRMRYRSAVAFAGHVTLHVVPALAIEVVALARPTTDELSSLGVAWGTLLAVLFGTTYAIWKVRPDNPYHVKLNQMRVMMVAALVAGLAANLAAFVRLS